MRLQVVVDAEVKQEGCGEAAYIPLIFLLES